MTCMCSRCVCVCVCGDGGVESVFVSFFQVSYFSTKLNMRESNGEGGIKQPKIWQRA